MTSEEFCEWKNAKINITFFGWRWITEKHLPETQLSNGCSNYISLLQKRWRKQLLSFFFKMKIFYMEKHNYISLKRNRCIPVLPFINRFLYITIIISLYIAYLQRKFQVHILFQTSSCKFCSSRLSVQLKVYVKGWHPCKYATTYVIAINLQMIMTCDCGLWETCDCGCEMPLPSPQMSPR